MWSQQRLPPSLSYAWTPCQTFKGSLKETIRMLSNLFWFSTWQNTGLLLCECVCASVCACACHSGKQIICSSAIPGRTLDPNIEMWRWRESCSLTVAAIFFPLYLRNKSWVRFCESNFYRLTSNVYLVPLTYICLKKYDCLKSHQSLSLLVGQGCGDVRAHPRRRGSGSRPAQGWHSCATHVG